MPNTNIKEMLQSIAVSMQLAQNAIELNSYAMFLENFKQSNAADNILVPKIQKFNMSKDKDKVIEVPIVSLMNHNGLSLEQVKITLNVKKFMVNDAQECELQIGAAADGEDAAGGNDGSIEILLKRSEPNEGFARLNQEALKIF